MKSLFLALMATTLLVAPASAVTITQANIGDTGVGTLNGTVGGVPIAGLNASLSLTLDSVTADTNTWFFSYSLENTSGGQIDASRVTSFGFDTDPTLSTVGPAGTRITNVLTESVFDVIELGSNVPEGFGRVDFCLTTGNCTGGGSGGDGVFKGQTETGSFALDFAGTAGTLTAITLDNFFARFQGINSVALNFNGQSGVGTGGPTQFCTVQPCGVAVPGPLAGAGLPALLALGGFVWARRRKTAAA